MTKGRVSGWLLLFSTNEHGSEWRKELRMKFPVPLSMGNLEVMKKRLFFFCFGRETNALFVIIKFFIEKSRKELTIFGRSINFVNIGIVLQLGSGRMNFKLNLFRLMFTYKKVAILSLILMLAVTGLNLINPLITKTLVDEAIPTKNVHLLILCLVGIVLIPVVTTVFSSIDSIYKEEIGTRISSSLR
jgi:hypothetical protein